MQKHARAALPKMFLENFRRTRITAVFPFFFLVQKTKLVSPFESIIYLFVFSEHFLTSQTSQKYFCSSVCLSIIYCGLSLAGMHTYIHLMEFLSTNWQYLYPEFANIQQRIMMTCASFVQMAEILYFVMDAQGLSTEVQYNIMGIRYNYSFSPYCLYKRWFLFLVCFSIWSDPL